ncbi:MAG: DUF3618 domain-containing protein [Gemmatimonadaceae bacterium]
MIPGDEGYDTGYIGGGPNALRVDELVFVEVDKGAAQDDPNAIRADISETRDRMSDTLDEIGERLNPHRVTEQVKDSIREATIGRVENMAQQAADRVSETKRGIMNTIEENPIPAAMVGLGLGWMMWNSRSNSSNSSVSQYAAGDRNLTGSSRQSSNRGYSERGYGTSSYGGYGAGTSHAGNDDSGVVDTLRDKASDLGGAARDAAGNLGDTVKGAAGNLTDRAQNVAGTVAQGTRAGTRRVEDAFYDNPLLTGAVTLALGLAAGLAAPRTHPEVALMGDARDEFGDRMRGVVQDTKHKAEHIAERVVDETKNAAHQEGLTAR